MINIVWFIVITITVWISLFIIGNVIENIIITYNTSKDVNKNKELVEEIIKNGRRKV